MQKVLCAVLLAAFLLLPIGAAADDSHKRALDSLPCPSGDASCGNGAGDTPADIRPPQNNEGSNQTEVSGNPSQKIEDASDANGDDAEENAEIFDAVQPDEPRIVNHPK